MPNILFGLKRPKLVGILALLGISSGILAYTAFLSPDTTPINQPIGYVAQDEVTSFNLTSGAETLYRPEYIRAKWSGNLHAYPVDAVGNLDTSAERWAGGASEQITAQNWDTGRLIATMKDTGAGISFRAASLSAAQAATLAATINSTAYSSTQIVSYLRGDTTNEGSGLLRTRASKLGDIIHSRPFYVDDTDPTVFVGANDGMLHAINADTGAERWAYVPSMLISKLKTLAYNTDDLALPFAHDYFVDGQINVGNITIASTSTRVLFGSLGGGGKGLYALNVSTLGATTEAEVANKVLWEINPAGINNATGSTAYQYLGYTYGTPQIVKINNGGTSVDAIIVGNGLNTTNANGESYLYVINAATGALIQAVQAGTRGGAQDTNGLFNPVGLDTNNDGYVDRVYAGDLKGTMWVFDLSSTTPSSWTSSALLTTSPAQPITSTPGVGAHPKGGYMVTFGTGSTLNGAYGTYDHGTSTWTTAATGELANNAVHYVYGIWDGAPIANAVLLTQTLTERSYTASGVTTRVRRSTANVPDWTSGATHHKGWKVALPAGERVVGEGSFTENGRFYFNSYNPTVIPTLVSGTNTDLFGENWLMELNYLTGGSSTSPFLDMDSNLLLNDADRIVYISSDAKPGGKVDGDPITSPSEEGIPVGKWISLGVQSQPILVQLQTLNTTLINQNPDVIYPPVIAVARGVAGGHFDVDNFYGANNNCTGVNNAGTPASGGRIDFTYSGSKTVSNFSITINGTEILTSNNPGSKSRSGLETWVGANSSSADYYITISSSRINIRAKNNGAAYNATTANIVVSATGIASGDYSKQAITGGTDNSGGALSSVAGTNCDYVHHEHEYDDKYDKTGVNMLNASQSNYNLSKAIPDATTDFKVLMMNQYLSPAVSLHIGDASYNPASSVGYISIKNYQASAGLDLTTVPTYNRNTIGSLAINMPVDAFSIKSWWATGDPRAGLHSVSPGCTWDGSGVGADMYQAVTPPANGTDGPGVVAATTGARHNGALTVQIIKAATPASAVEENVTGRPEYGYRVKHANFYDYVLVEYIFYWHHPRNMCYSTSGTSWKQDNNDGDAWNTVALMTGTGWTKAPPEDIAVSSASSTPATGSTDPKLGILGSTGTVTSTTTTVSGNVTTTTIVYNDGTSTVIVQTANNNGTVTIETTQRLSTGVVASITTVTVANAAGSVKTGGDERGLIARTGRISWRELTKP
jgi:Tfp pilus tip-associated adhesin PilY1